MIQIGSFKNRILEIKTGSLVLLGFRRTMVAITVFALGWLLITFVQPVTSWLDFRLTDMFQNAAARFRTAHPDIIVAAIDTETLDESGTRWPWPRRRLANLLLEIGRLQPEMIILDILLQNPQAQNPEEDEYLAETIRKLGNVILVYLIEQTRSETGMELQQFHNLPIFRDSAASEGFVWVPIDDDGLIREVILSDARIAKDSCALIAARSRNPGIRRPVSSGILKSLLAIPRKQGGIKAFSVIDLLGNRLPKELLKGKIVVLGATAPVLHDFHRTSYGIVSGVEILAASIDMLLNDRLIRLLHSTFWRMSGGFIGVLGGVFCSILLIKWPLLISSLAAIMFALIILGIFIFFGYFPPLGVLLICWVYGSIWGYSGIRFIEFIKNQIMNAEATAIGEIQRMIFPDNLTALESGFWCAGRCMPCEEAGGDYYDFFPLEERKLFFMLGDVTGHGFAAAMVTSIVKSIVTNFRLAGDIEPMKLLETLNRVIFEIVKRKKMITLLAGRIELDTGETEISFGGQLPAFHLKNDGTLEEIGAPAFPVGASARFRGNSRKVRIEPGERLIIYSDGIVEALDWKDRPYEFTRWKEFCSMLPKETFEDLWNRVLNSLAAHTHGRPFVDDVTFVVISRPDVESITK